MPKKRPPEPEPRRKVAPVSENLAGEPCEHTWERYRGFRMCSQPLCAALSTMDGYALSREERRALIAQLRREGLEL